MSTADSHHACSCGHDHGSHSRDHICWGGGQAHHCRHELRLENLSVSYGETAALCGINLSIPCGQTLALIGPNGAGKSTLLNALAGLLPRQAACKGTMLWNGSDLHRTRHEIAFMPQRSEVDWRFPLTVRELVSMGRYPALGAWGTMRQHDRDIIDKALTTLRLTELQNRQIGELSGGQQQRAFLARALAQEAHILLLDEPFTGLDVPSMQTLAELLRALAAEGRLIIASHHELATAADIFDQALLLRGRAVAFGSTAAVLSQENLSLTFTPAQA